MTRREHGIRSWGMAPEQEGFGELERCEDPPPAPPEHAAHHGLGSDYAPPKREDIFEVVEQGACAAPPKLTMNIGMTHRKPIYAERPRGHLSVSFDEAGLRVGVSALRNTLVELSVDGSFIWTTDSGRLHIPAGMARGFVPRAGSR